jgi:tetratricopeptide (TPR) repeat protein
MQSNNRGLEALNRGEYDKGIADFNEALRLNPTLAVAYYNRAEAWRNKGEYDRAIADYNQAVAIDPTLAVVYSNLAWLFATCADEKYRDGKRAVENARKACQLTGEKKWGSIATLAASYAESGDFDKASVWQAKASETNKTVSTWKAVPENTSERSVVAVRSGNQLPAAGQCVGLAA